MLSGSLLSYLKKRKISRNGHSLSFVVPLVVTRCHSLSLVVPLVVIRCHSLSFVVTRCTTRCHSLYHSLSFVVTRCTTRCHSLSFVVTRCTTRCHSLSLDVLLVCLFINDLLNQWKSIGFPKLITKSFIFFSIYMLFNEI